MSYTGCEMGEGFKPKNQMRRVYYTRDYSEKTCLYLLFLTYT
jgi:hypothetical protein